MLRLAGVVDVITTEDIPGKKIRSMFGYNEELLATTEVDAIPRVHSSGYLHLMGLLPCVQVSCVGQIICAVVANTRAHAKRAAAEVQVTYEDLPDPVYTIQVRDPAPE